MGAGARAAAKELRVDTDGVRGAPDGRAEEGEPCTPSGGECSSAGDASECATPASVLDVRKAQQRRLSDKGGAKEAATAEGAAAHAPAQRTALVAHMRSGAANSAMASRRPPLAPNTGASRGRPPAAAVARGGAGHTLPSVLRRLKARKGAKGYKRKVLKAHATLPDLLSSQLGMGGLARALEKRAMWLAISERRELMRAQALGVLQ